MWFRIRPHFNVCISIITGKASPMYCIYLPGIHTTPGHLVTTWFCNKFNVIAWFLNLIKFRLVIRSCTNSIVNIIVRVMVLYMHLDIFFSEVYINTRYMCLKLCLLWERKQPTCINGFPAVWKPHFTTNHLEQVGTFFHQCVPLDLNFRKTKYRPKIYFLILS